MKVISVALTLLLFATTAFSQEMVDPSLSEPPPPPKKNSKYIQHPNAAKGLVKISRDGSYLYRTQRSIQDRTFSLKIGEMPAPQIIGYQRESYDPLTYDSMYGTKPVGAFQFEYEWMLAKKWGDTSLQLGVGAFSASAHGRLKKDPTVKSVEKFNLMGFPLTLGLVYRFNYMRRQIVVPYISGGGQYIGLLELRDDTKKYYVAGSFGATAAGGVLISLSRWGDRLASQMDSEYGINDLWLSIEARRIQSVKKDLDFSSNMITAGVTMDL